MSQSSDSKPHDVLGCLPEAYLLASRSAVCESPDSACPQFPSVYILPKRRSCNVISCWAIAVVFVAFWQKHV